MVKEIRLQGKHSDKVVLVDDADYEWLSQYKWYYQNGYTHTVKHKKGCSRDSPGRSISNYMHRMIMRPEDSKQQIDHINGKRLDNRRENLRIVTNQENSFNKEYKVRSSSGYLGVKHDKRDNLYYCRVGTKFYGSYKTAELAAKVYDKVVSSQRGDFKQLNFSDEPLLSDDFKITNFNSEPQKAKYQSDCPGVSYLNCKAKRRKRWRAIHNKKTIGYFMTEQEAIDALCELKKSEP